MEIGSFFCCSTAPCHTRFTSFLPPFKNLNGRCHASFLQNSSKLSRQKQSIPMFVGKKGTFQSICRARGKTISPTDDKFAIEVETPEDEESEDMDNLPTPAAFSSDYIESLPLPVQKRVEALQELQDRHSVMEATYFEELAALDVKYEKLYEPLYKKRYEIVNGIVDVEDAMVEEAADLEEGIPEFWLTAMLNNDTLAMQITERDEDALKFLKDIRSNVIDSGKDESGFKLEFFFSENPYFKNSVLTKVYHWRAENDPTSNRVIGTEIDWFPGKNITQKILRKKPKKGAKDVKPVIKIEKCDSFFDFFNTPKLPEDDVEEKALQNAMEEFQNVTAEHLEIGFTFKDELIPHALNWFTGDGIEAFDDNEDLSENDDA